MEAGIPRKKARTGERSEELFNEVYPLYGQMALEELGPQFNLLVMDEAQDLCRKERLDVLNDAIRGGLSGGRWAVFGDFSRQNIYDYGEKEELVGTLKNYCHHPARSRLTLNCRNTRRIAEETYLLSGFESPPSRFGKEQGPPVEYDYWKNSEDLVNLLERKIKGCLRKGFPLRTW